MATVLCITGMHRSGTSLTASWLQSCGLRIDDGCLIGSAAGNPHGHFEDLDFVELHSRRLKSSNRRSKGWIAVKGLNCGLRDGFLEEAQKLVERRSSKYSLWGWKDPRTSLFLTEWKRLIPEMKVVCVWRPCFDVVGSLLTRARKPGGRDFKLSLWDAVNTWRTYNEYILDYRRNNRASCILLPISHVVENDERVLEEIKERLGLSLSWTPIAQVYDGELLRKHSPSAMTRVIAKVCGAAGIEEELRQYSDMAQLVECNR
jgi:hypothetical protein